MRAPKSPAQENKFARLAALDYQTGVEIRKEQLQLSAKVLARKFECSPGTIARVRAHAPVETLSQEEQALIRQCCKEHDRLEARHTYFTKAFLSKQYGVPTCAIDRELDRMGFINPLSRKVAEA